jgi:hypothetical protein
MVEPKDHNSYSISVKKMVGDTGIEPVTPAMSMQCSPAELIARQFDVRPWASRDGGSSARLEGGQGGCCFGLLESAETLYAGANLQEN